MGIEEGGKVWKSGDYGNKKGSVKVCGPQRKEIMERKKQEEWENKLAGRHLSLKYFHGM